MFNGRVSSDGTKLSNVQYGANYSGREGMTLDQELAQLEAEGADAKAFAEAVRDLLTGSPAAVLTKENPSADLEAGYYIIIDESSYEGNGDSLSDYIVAVAGNVKVQPKSTGVPGFDKSIDEREDEPQAPDNPDNPVAPPFEVPEGADISPETADIDWNYTLHEDTGVITLNYYTGTKTDVRVYSHYKVPDDDRVWKAELADGLETYTTYGNYMFFGKKGITSVTFSDNLNTASCTNMRFMFFNCLSLEKVVFGNRFNTSNVTDMNGMFNGCKALKILDVSKFKTGKVKNMGFMFSNCSSLTDLDVSGFDTSNVEKMNSMFQYCSNLAMIDVSGFSTGKVTDMSAMFSNCSSLTDLDVSGFDTSNTTNMENMFYRCGKITTLDVSGFDTSKVTDMSAMFSICSSLTDLDVSGFDTSNVTNMNTMFEDCSSLTDLNVSGFDTSNVTNMCQMFCKCSALIKLDLSMFNTSNVTDMQGMFNGCSAASVINVKNFDTSNVTDMSTMFYDCLSLTSLDLLSFDTSNTTCMNDMFENCTNITEIKVSLNKWVTDQADMLNMFDNCGVSEVTFVTPTASAASAGVLPEAYASGMNTVQDGTAESSDAIEIEDDDTSVSYGIGDSIPYKLTATMPESITAYKKYKLVFHDKLSAGLDYNRDSLKVFAGSTEILAENYTAVYSEDGKSLTVMIEDAKAAPWNAVQGTEISVKYSAVLNENAEAKNRNEAWLEYSNDPKGDGTGETGPGVPDTVDVYTFEIRFDKVDRNGDPLAGAGFTLYKKDDADVFQPFGEEIKGVTRFSFKGLAAGEYKLVETTTPDGYNTMEDFVFRIDAETADGTDGKIKRITMIPVSGGAGAWTSVAADMAFESDIANYTGSTLPSTGGMGTYAFYLAGAAVVITVGTVMAAKKKEDKE